MDNNDLKQHLDSRLDRLEGKLDDHLERISKAEASIEWLRGHAKIVTTLILTALSGAVIAAWSLLTKGIP
jgi:Holliday junction resolvasome RuvABC endonuclease subunit